MPNTGNSKHFGAVRHLSWPSWRPATTRRRGAERIFRINADDGRVFFASGGNKHIHLQCSTFPGCCEIISNVCKSILVGILSNINSDKLYMYGKDFRKRYYIISISRLESLLFRYDTHIIFIHLYFLFFDDIIIS